MFIPGLDQWILGIFSSGLTFGIGFLITKHSNRIDNLEKETRASVKKDEVKELVSDKIEPLHVKINEIDKKVDKLLNVILQKGK